MRHTAECEGVRWRMGCLGLSQGWEEPEMRRGGGQGGGQEAARSRSEAAQLEAVCTGRQAQRAAPGRPVNDLWARHE